MNNSETLKKKIIFRSKHRGTNKYNIHYKGLAVKVPAVDRYKSVIYPNKLVKSLDSVMIIKDQRD